MKLQRTDHGPRDMLPHVGSTPRVIVALGLSALLAGLACRDAEPEDMKEDQAEPIDVQAIVWCVFSFGSGETADGEEIRDRSGIQLRVEPRPTLVCACRSKFSPSPAPNSTRSSTKWRSTSAKKAYVSKAPSRQTAKSLSAYRSTTKRSVTPMTGHHHQSSRRYSWAVLVGLLLVGPWGCADRPFEDEALEPEPMEHPPELLARYDEACEAWCELSQECGYDISCSCRSRSAFNGFDDRFTLCVEKAALYLECQAALTCEGVDRFLDHDGTTAAQDSPCKGQGIAQTAACRVN